MPTYEYHCQKCQQNFEAVQSMKDPHFSVCPEGLCRMASWGQGPVTRLLGTGAGLIFKGSGFYITDYRSKNYQEAAKKESSSGGGGGESKPGGGGGDAGKAPTATPAPSPAAPAGGGSSGSSTSAPPSTAGPTTSS